jgi:hypothetical protein
MKKHLAAVFALSMIVVLVGGVFAEASMKGAGMSGGQMAVEQSPQVGGDKSSEPPGQMPMTQQFAARMMNACLGAMEGIAQMGRMMGTMGGMMGGQGGTSQTPSEQKQ